MNFQFGHGSSRSLMHVASIGVIANEFPGVKFVALQPRKGVASWSYYFEAQARGYDHDVPLTRAVAARLGAP